MSDTIHDIVQNKKARFEYEILETFEAGIVLVGTEVKSVRQKKVSINEAYARIWKGEAYLTGMNISAYEMGNRFNHEPVRDRKLLLHTREIRRLTGKLQERGYTMVPLKLYFKNGKVKVLLGLAKGKAQYDKRSTIKTREANRELQREIKKHR
ncbi:MAG: SsrA-binding protein SmpB [Spirochaetes bacterium]|nr:MAG: SsrA-binding protein SmpB [Spirochaetota bacterium]